MKQLYMLLLCFISAYSITAQTTIDNSDLPVAGNAFAISTDTPASINIGTASPSAQNWDFTGLQMLSNDTFSYFNPALTPQGSAFPTSDMATYSKNPPVAYSYFKHRAGGLFIQGISIDASAFGIGIINLKATPEEKYIQNPTTYGTSYAVNSVYQVSFNKNPGDQDTVIKHFVKRTVNADAFGSITTNFGTYNTIRVHSYEITADTFYVTYFGVPILSQPSGNDTANVYSFLIDTTGHPIATVHADAANNIQSVEFLTSDQVMPTASFYADSTIVQVNQPVKFNDYSAAASNWEWDFGDGSAVSTKQAPTHSYSNTGFYSPTQRVYNSTGSDTLTIPDYITVVSSVADFLVDNETPNTGQPVNFTNTSAYSTGWKWDFGDGSAISTQQFPSHSYSNPGIYDVKLIAYNQYNSDTLTKVDYITVSVATAIKENFGAVAKIYPNPANDQINFLFSDSKEKLILIFDVTGKCVSSFTSTGNSAIVNTSLFKQGLYFYKITSSESEFVTGKFSVVK